MQKMLKKLLLGLKVLLERRGQAHVKFKLPELQKLAFFHSVYFGAKKSHPCEGWLTQDGCFASSSPISIVVHHKGKLSGVIGFELLPRSVILVRLLQGAPDAGYPHGVKAAEYLMTCAEQIARTLEMEVIRIISAETVIEYRRAHVAGGQLAEFEIQRLKNMYNYAEKRGYTQKFCLRLRQPTHYQPLS